MNTLLACLLSLGLSAPPELKVPSEVKGEPAEFLRVPAETTGKSVKWLPLDKGLAVFPTELLKDSKTAVVTAKAPGRYRLLAVTALADELSEPAICLVIVGDSPTPTPPGPHPNPGPAPGPTPAPPAKAWVVVIEETSESAASRGGFLADRDLLGYLQSKGWKARVADKDARDAQGRQPADLAPYLTRAAGKKLPCLFVVDQDGTVRLESALPATPAELLALLKKIGG